MDHNPNVAPGPAECRPGLQAELRSSLSKFAGETPRQKVFWDGAHRVADPEETFDRIRPHLGQMGITRLAEVTGLDRIGIPVVQAVMPMSRCLSVKQGKGRTRMAAVVSAAMEAIESRHAEAIRLPTITTSRIALLAQADVTDLHELSIAPTNGDPDSLNLTWVRGQNLISGDEVWAPLDCVHMDFTRDLETTFLLSGSNGLASGNTTAEALLSALYEVIERDCMADFHALRQSEQRRRRVWEPALLESRSADIVERINEAGAHTQVWDMTNDFGVYAFAASIFEVGNATLVQHPAPVLRPQLGYGCHLDPEIALSRALTEAIQSRLTRIAGARDDLHPEDYKSASNNNLLRIFEDIFSQDEPGCAPARLPDRSGKNCEEDILTLLDRFSAMGIRQVAGFDLSDPVLGIPVVRVVAVGLGHLLPGENSIRGSRRQERRTCQ